MDYFKGKAKGRRDVEIDAAEKLDQTMRQIEDSKKAEVDSLAKRHETDLDE